MMADRSILFLHALRCAADRLWDFYIPIVIASLHSEKTKDLAPAAALRLVSAIAGIAGISDGGK